MNTVILHFYNCITSIIPETKAFKFKNSILKLAGAQIGKNVRICSSARILGNGIVNIGNNTWIGPEVMIVASSKIMIGANVDIAPRVYIGTGTHEIDFEGERVAGKDISLDVSIENGVWIGTNSLILPGVTVGTKSIIAAGAVVTKNVIKRNLVGGIPAKVIKDFRTKF